MVDLFGTGPNPVFHGFMDIVDGIGCYYKINYLGGFFEGFVDVSERVEFLLDREKRIVVIDSIEIIQEIVLLIGDEHVIDQTFELMGFFWGKGWAGVERF